MCWNENVSLNTFLFSSFVLTLIIYNNYYTNYKIEELNNNWMYLFYASFIFMQLIEFFIWRNINNKIYNQFFSILGLLLLFIQPIASIMIMRNIKMRHLLLVSYILVAIPYLIYQISTNQIYSIVSKYGHLKWIVFPLVVWIVWLFFFVFSFVYQKMWLALSFCFMTLLISFFNYINDETVGSMWCWSINSIMIYFAIYLLFYLPFLEKRIIC